MYIIQQQTSDMNTVAEWHILRVYQNTDNVAVAVSWPMAHAKGYYEALNILQTFEDHDLLREKVTVLEQAIDEALQRQESDAELLLEFINQAAEMRRSLAVYEAAEPEIEPSVVIDYDVLFDMAETDESPQGLFDIYANE